MDDLISRQAALEAISYSEVAYYPGDAEGDVLRKDSDVKNALMNVPAAQPERKKGKWIIRKFGQDAQCSECKMYFRDVYDMDNADAFCRHCGAKMEGLKVVKHG